MGTSRSFSLTRFTALGLGALFAANVVAQRLIRDNGSPIGDNQI
jgi:hypothetical protein